jgi:hypothetical protein
MTDPLAMSLAGGGEVGNTIRRMTEGPRFSDIGATEHRMAKLMDLWISVQTAARSYKGIVAGAWMTANRRFARDISSRSTTETQVKGGKQLGVGRGIGEYGIADVLEIKAIQR